MTEPSDRDAALDRILPGFASAQEPSTFERCLDAETVAAMADGGLAPHERAGAEAHASTCARCQALIAALVRTAPEPEPSRAWWRMPAVRWLAPLAATGLAAALWVAVGTRQPTVVTVSVPATAPESKESPAPRALEDRQVTSAVAAPRDARAYAPPEVAGPPAAASPAPASPAEARKRERLEQASPVDQLARAKQKDDAALDKAAGAAAPAPMSPAPVEELAARSNAGVRGGSDAPPGSVAQSKAVRTDAFAPRAAVGGLAESVLVATDIVSSDPRARWRIAGASVQRSTDQGATWTDQTTGTTSRLTAGSAPQPDICWIVGDAGTVLLTVDGLSWQRLPPPVQRTLVSVSATSADAATVTASDGRTFATTDRGRTWSAR